MAYGVHWGLVPAAKLSAISNRLTIRLCSMAFESVLKEGESEMPGARAHQLLIVAIALMIAGCGRQKDRWLAARPATAPARGEVTYLGKPLEGAIVVFQPAAPGGIGASAVTDAQGHFVLQTFPPTLGAVPGRYSVSVMKTEMPTGGTGDPNDPSPIQAISLIPEKYSIPTISELTATIPEEGTEDLVFHLKN